MNETVNGHTTRTANPNVAKLTSTAKGNKRTNVSGQETSYQFDLECPCAEAEQLLARKRHVFSRRVSQVDLKIFRDNDGRLSRFTRAQSKPG